MAVNRNGVLSLPLQTFAEFEAFLVSICHAFADLRQRNGKISDFFKTSTSIVLQQCQNKVRFQREGSGVVLKF